MKRTKVAPNHTYCQLCHKMSEEEGCFESSKYKVDFILGEGNNLLYQKKKYWYYKNYFLEG